MELIWVGLNLLGIEHVTTEPVVRSVSDVHLAYMPWSHSMVTMLGTALLVGLGLWAVGRPRLGLALGLGVASHFVLDFSTHDHDLAFAPGLGGRLGIGLYGSAPLIAFAVELVYGILCWRLFRGSWALLGIVVGFNLANLSFFWPALPGPEQLLANHPTAVVLVVLAQIVVTLVLVGIFARRSRRSGRPDSMSLGPFAEAKSSG